MFLIDRLKMVVSGDKNRIFTFEWRNMHYYITAKCIENLERDYKAQIGKNAVAKYLKDKISIKYVLEVYNVEKKSTVFMYVTTANKIIFERNCEYSKNVYKVFGFEKEEDNTIKFLKEVDLAVRKCIRETEIQTQCSSNSYNKCVIKKEYIKETHKYPLCIARNKYGSKKTDYQKEKEKQLLGDKYWFFQKILEENPNLTIRFTDDLKRALSIEKLFRKFGGREANNNVK